MNDDRENWKKGEMAGQGTKKLPGQKTQRDCDMLKYFSNTRCMTWKRGYRKSRD
jgi:phosphoribosyl-AMP cyclohydrolase